MINKTNKILVLVFGVILPAFLIFILTWLACVKGVDISAYFITDLTGLGQYLTPLLEFVFGTVNNSLLWNLLENYFILQLMGMLLVLFLQIPLIFINLIKGGRYA